MQEISFSKKNPDKIFYRDIEILSLNPSIFKIARG